MSDPTMVEANYDTDWKMITIHIGCKKVYFTFFVDATHTLTFLQILQAMTYVEHVLLILPTKLPQRHMRRT